MFYSREIPDLILIEYLSNNLLEKCISIIHDINHLLTIFNIPIEISLNYNIV